jgi:hypothetical protein
MEQYEAPTKIVMEIYVHNFDPPILFPRKVFTFNVC